MKKELNGWTQHQVEGKLKESGNFKIEQLKLLSLNNKGNTDWEGTKKEYNISDPSDLIKDLIFVSPGEERKAKKYMVKLPNLAKDTNHQIQETVRNPRRISPKLSIPRHIMLNVLKAKDREKKKSTST